MKKTLLLGLILSSSFMGYSQNEMNNQSIIDLIDLGFESEIIKAKINSTPGEYDTSLSELKILKEKGVKPDVLALMIEKSKKEVKSGLFYIENNKEVEIKSTVFSGTRTNALGAAFSYGIASAKIKSYVNGAKSGTELEANNLTFIFQFDKNKNDGLATGNWWFKQATSPSDFVLTKLKKKKNRRELITGRVTGITASTQMGISESDAIKFITKDLKNGRFEISFEKPLLAGEYCFFYQGNIPIGGLNQSIYDFSIKNLETK